MNVIDTLIQCNQAFASSKFSADLKIIPSLKTMIIGCVDPRVDPVEIFGLEPGEAAVIRNVGGRVTPSTLQTMRILSSCQSSVATTESLVLRSSSRRDM
jgi:carbonic anhydrase